MVVSLSPSLSRFIAVSIPFGLAMHAQCMPIDGILFHHAIEMLLKGGLLQKRTLSDVEEMTHWLKKMWRAFTEAFPAPQLKHHHGAILYLAKYPHLPCLAVASA